MKKINWGLRAHDLGPAELDELARRIRSKGFTHIHLAPGKAIEGFSPAAGRLTPGVGQIIKNGFGKHGISVSILGCYINPVHPDPAARAREVAKFVEHLTYVRDFGCSLVGTETGSPMPDNSFSPDIYSEECFQTFMESLQTMVDAAEKVGSIVAIEGVADRHTIHNHERMMRALEMIPSPNLKVIYDPVNFLPSSRVNDSDRLMEEAFELFGDRICAVHAKDFRFEDGQVNGTYPAGQGEFNFPLLVELINRYKPMVQVTLENNSPETIDDTIKFLKSVSEFY